VPFDDLADALGVQRDIVKIDVHGAEGNVISGMTETLRKHVSALCCELHDEMTDGFSANPVRGH
jgi:FkbM family methyltransferase